MHMCQYRMREAVPNAGWILHPAAVAKVSKSVKFDAGQAQVQTHFVPGSLCVTRAI